MIDDVPDDILRVILSKISVFDIVKLSTTCSKLRSIPLMYGYGNHHQMMLKHYVNNQILCIRKEWIEKMKIQKKYPGSVWVPNRFIVFILSKNICKKELVSDNYTNHKKKMTLFLKSY